MPGGGTGCRTMLRCARCCGACAVLCPMPCLLMLCGFGLSSPHRLGSDGQLQEPLNCCTISSQVQQHLVRPPSAAKTGEWRSDVTDRERRPWSAARPGGRVSGRCRGAAGAAAPRRSSSDSAVRREMASGSCRVQGSGFRSQRHRLLVLMCSSATSAVVTRGRVPSSVGCICDTARGALRGQSVDPTAAALGNCGCGHAFIFPLTLSVLPSATFI